MKEMKVYLCGPIAKNCWRHKIVPRLSQISDWGDAISSIVLPTIDYGLLCNGPWFVSTNYGPTHDPGRHGAVSTTKLHQVLDEQQEIFNVNLERIRCADAVFAYIDRAEAYGSMVEIGFAHALGKPIFIAFPLHSPWREDMWFPVAAGIAAEPIGSSNSTPMEIEGYNCHLGSVENTWDMFAQTMHHKRRHSLRVIETGK